MKNNVLLKYNGGSNRRSIGLGAFIEARAVAVAAVANLKAAASSYTDLVRSGVARECGDSCVSECLHLSAVNRLVARIREAQAVVPGALRRLVEIGLDAVVDAETRSALALRPRGLRPHRPRLARRSVLLGRGDCRPRPRREEAHVQEPPLPPHLAPRAGRAGVARGARPRLAARLLPLRCDPSGGGGRRPHRGRRPPGRPEGRHPGRRLAGHNQPQEGRPASVGGPLHLSKPASSRVRPGMASRR